MGRRFILASASPARLRLLEAAGFAPEVMVSGVDEDGVDIDNPHEHVVELARRKAAAVAARPEAGGALVLGCDSMLEFGGQLRGKPSSPAEAIARWEAMRGHEGRLLTGHCLIDTAGPAGSPRRAEAAASTTVRFGQPTDAEVAAYVARGEPLRVAGAFTIDGLAAPFIDGVDGDPGNVIGVSLPLLRTLLARLDVEVTSLWH